MPNLEIHTKYCYSVLILSAIPQCRTGLKALFNPSDCRSTAQAHQVTNIPLTEGQRLKDDHLSMSLRFFSLPLETGPNDRGLPFLSGHPSHYVYACTWICTHVLWVRRQVCYPLGQNCRKVLQHRWKLMFQNKFAFSKKQDDILSSDLRKLWPSPDKNLSLFFHNLGN